MTKEEFTEKYKNAESHFDVALTAFTRSPLSLVLFLVWTVGVWFLGRLGVPF